MRENARADPFYTKWVGALWLLDLLPRPVDAALLGKLQRRKLTQAIDLLLAPTAIGELESQTQVVDGAPFDLCLLHWLERRGVQHPSLSHSITLRSAAWENLRSAAGGAEVAYQLLRSCAAAQVAEPDIDFSEAAIRRALVRSLVTRGRKSPGAS